MKRKRRKEERGLNRPQKEKPNNGNTEQTLVLATTAATFTRGRENPTSKPLQCITSLGMLEDPNSLGIAVGFKAVHSPFYAMATFLTTAEGDVGGDCEMRVYPDRAAIEARR